MKKYIKKPIVVEAIKFTRSNYEEVMEFTDGNAFGLSIEKCINGKCHCFIKTLESSFCLNEFDYIVKDTEGNYYSCNEYTFEKDYDEVY